MCARVRAAMDTQVLKRGQRIARTAGGWWPVARFQSHGDDHARPERPGNGVASVACCSHIPNCTHPVYAYRRATAA
jgi:hypothetical protein